MTRPSARSAFIGAASALAVVGALWGLSQVMSREAPPSEAPAPSAEATTHHEEAAAPAPKAQATLPAGHDFAVRTQTEVKTGRAREGDRVTAVLVQDLYAGDVLVASAGDRVEGHVAYVASARETRDKAALELVFDEIHSSSRGVIPISASVQSHEIEDRADRAERNADIAWTVGGAVVGAVIGNQRDGGRDERRSGRTTGAAIGAATGLLISTQTGSDFTLRPGTRLVLRLQKAVEV